MLQQVEGALDGQEAVGVLFLADSVKENREHVVVVEVGDALLPFDLVAGTGVVELDGQVAAVVVPSEIAGRVHALLVRAGHGRCRGALGDWLVQREGFTPDAVALLEHSWGGGGGLGDLVDGEILLIERLGEGLLGLVVLWEVAERGVLDFRDERLVALLIRLARALSERVAEVVLKDDLVGRADLAARNAHHVRVRHRCGRYLLFIITFKS